MWRASAVAVLLVSCGSPPPGSVDHEALLVDLSACTRNEATCEKSGDVVTTDDLAGEGLALRLGPGGSVTLPVRNDGARRLVWIAIGLRAQDAPRKLSVSMDGKPAAVVEPGWGWARIELDVVGQPISGGTARLRLLVEQGTFELHWVVGRFRD